MIKEYVCSKLNQYLSSFIDEIDENDLLLSLYDGNVQLHNVRLSKSFLKDCNFAKKIEEIRIGELSLTIPWLSLSSSSVQVTLDNISILLTNEETDSVNSLDDRVVIENDLSMEHSTFSSSIPDYSSVLEFFTVTCNRIDVSIQNFHIRLINKRNTHSSYYYAAGTIIKELSLTAVKNESELIHCTYSEYLHKSLVVKGLSIYCDTNNSYDSLLDQSLHIIDGLNAYLELAYDIRKNRVSSYDDIISLTNTVLNEHQQSSLLRCLQDHSVLYNTTRLHSVEDLRLFLESHLLDDFGEQCLREVAGIIYPSIKYQSPLLTVRGCIDSCSSTLQSSSLQFINNIADCFAVKTIPFSASPVVNTNPGSLTPWSIALFLVTRVFSSYSSILLTLLTLICFPFWLYYSFATVMGGFLTMGTGLLYYYRFFKKTQEDRAPELDEERESNSTLCSVSVVLNSLSGQVMNDDRESIIKGEMKNVHLVVNGSYHEIKGNVEIESCNCTDLQSHITPFCSIQFCRNDLWTWAGCCSSLSIDLSVLCRIWNEFYCLSSATATSSNQELGVNLHTISFPSVLLDLEELSVVHELSSTSFIIQSVQLLEKSSNVILVGSSNSHPQFSLYYQPTVPLKIHCSEILGELSLNHLLSFYSSLVSCSTSSSALLYEITIDRASLHLPSSFILSGSSITIGCVTPSDSMQSIQWSSKELTLEEFIPHQSPFVCVYSSEVHGYYSYSELASHFSYDADSTNICLHKHSLPSLSHCIETLCNIWNDFWYCVGISLNNSSSTEELSEVSDSDLLSSFIFDITGTSIRCLLVDSLCQIREHPSCFYDSVKPTASVEGKWNDFSFCYQTTPGSQEMVITSNACYILYPFHDPHPSEVRIEMSDVPGVYYHDTQKGLFRETKLDVGVSHIMYTSSLLTLPAMIKSFISDSSITAIPFPANPILLKAMTHTFSLSISELEVVGDPFTVMLAGYGSIKRKGSQVESWSMNLSRLEINDWLSMKGQCEIIDQSLRIKTSSITLSLDPILLSFLLNSLSSLPSSSSSLSCIIPPFFRFSITIPSVQLFLLSDQLPIIMLTAEEIHTKGHYNHKEFSLRGEMILEGDYYKNKVDEWEEVLHSWRVSGYYEKKDKMNTLTIDSSQVIDFTITKPFLLVSVPFVKQLSETISIRPSVSSVHFTKNGSCIRFVNYSGVDLSIDLLSGQQFEAASVVETFTLTRGSSYVSQQLAFPAFSSRLSTMTSLPSHLYARVNGPSFPSLRMELYSDDIGVVGNPTGDHLLAHSHVHDGQKEIVFSGRISLVNHSPIPLFYSIDGTGEGQLKGVTEPLVPLPMNEELFLPISVVSNVFSLCTEAQVRKIECSAILRLSLHTVVSSLDDCVVSMGRNRCCFTLHRWIHQVVHQKGIVDRIQIEIMPCLSVVNLLPISIPVILVDDLREYERIIVDSGQKGFILRGPVSLSKCRIQVQLDEKGEGRETHCLNESSTGLLHFDNSCIRYQFDETENAMKTIIVSAHYCVMNETESSIMLNHIGNNEQFYCPPSCTPSRPLFLSFNPSDHHVHSIRIRTDGYRWSRYLSVDAVNTDNYIEMISTKGLNSQFLLMTVAFVPESLSNSKMILFSSGYSIFNDTNHTLALSQTESYGSPLLIQPGDVAEFHWNEYSSNRRMQIQDLTQHSLWSDPFTVSCNEQFITLLFGDDCTVSSNTKPRINVRCDLSNYRHKVILSFPEADSDSQRGILDQDRDSYSISLSLAGVGVSLVEEMELSFLSFSALMIQFYRNESDDICVYSEINGIQIDSSSVNAHFPVVLGSNQQAVPLSDKTLLTGQTSVHSLNPESAFQLSIQCHSSPSLLTVSSCEFILSPTSLNLESQFVFMLIEFLSPFFTSKPVIRPFFKHPISTETNSRLVLIQSLFISPIQLNLSLYSSSQLPISQTIFYHHRIPSLFHALFDATGRILINVNTAPICLESLSYENTYTTLSTLIYQLRDYYIQKVYTELYKLVGSANILGNPSELVTSVEEGVKSFIDESTKGLKKGPKGAVTGIGKGALGLLSKTAYGILNSAERITDTLGDSIDSFNMLDHSRTERTSGKSGLVQGVKAGVEDFVDGLKSGSIEVVGKGVIGMIVKPIGGLIDDTSVLIGKAKSITNEEMKLERIRLPRFICPGPVVMEYCDYLVNGAWFVHNLLNSKNGTYFCHLPVNNNTMLLVFTTKQLILIDIHSHTLLWSCCYSSIDVQLKKHYLLLRNDHQVVTCFVHRQLFIYLIQYYLILFTKTIPSDYTPFIYSFVNRLLTGLECYPYSENCHYSFTKKQELRWILIESVILREIDDYSNIVKWNVRGCSYQWTSIMNESDIRLLHDMIFALRYRPVGLTRTIREGEELKIVIKEIEGVFSNYPCLLLTEEVDTFFKKNCHDYVKYEM